MTSTANREHSKDGLMAGKAETIDEYLATLSDDK